MSILFCQQKKNRSQGNAQESGDPSNEGLLDHAREYCRSVAGFANIYESYTLGGKENFSNYNLIEGMSAQATADLLDNVALANEAAERSEQSANNSGTQSFFSGVHAKSSSDAREKAQREQLSAREAKIKAEKEELAAREAKARAQAEEAKAREAKLRAELEKRKTIELKKQTEMEKNEAVNLKKKTLRIC